MFKTYFWDVLINHYVDFKGKASRTQYWLWVLWEVILCIALLILTIVLGYAKQILIVMAVVRLLLTLPNLSIVTRRLRDGGFSPWFVLLEVFSYVYLGFTMFMNNAMVMTNNTMVTKENPLLLLITMFLGLINFLCSVAIFIFMCLPSKETQAEQLN